MEPSIIIKHLRTKVSAICSNGHKKIAFTSNRAIETLDDKSEKVVVVRQPLCPVCRSVAKILGEC